MIFYVSIGVTVVLLLLYPFLPKILGEVSYPHLDLSKKERRHLIKEKMDFFKKRYRIYIVILTFVGIAVCGVLLTVFLLVPRLVFNARGYEFTLVNESYIGGIALVFVGIFVMALSFRFTHGHLTNLYTDYCFYRDLSEKGVYDYQNKQMKIFYLIMVALMPVIGLGMNTYVLYNEDGVIQNKFLSLSEESFLYEDVESYHITSSTGRSRRGQRYLKWSMDVTFKDGREFGYGSGDHYSIDMMLELKRKFDLLGATGTARELSDNVIKEIEERDESAQPMYYEFLSP